MQPEIESIPLRYLASGDRLYLQVYKFVGAKPGKKVYLQSNLHGAELAGNAVIYQLIEFFKKLKSSQLIGEIWLVPVCNPMSTNARLHQFPIGRFNLSDGRDWNRIFWDYEKACPDLEEFVRSQQNLDLETIQKNFKQQIKTAFSKRKIAQKTNQGMRWSDRYAYYLQSLAIDADYVIDLHTNSNQGLNYLYYFRDREESAKALQFEHAILLDQYDGDAFDEAFIKPWLALEACLARQGRPLQFPIEAWTLELGNGLETNLASVQQGIQGIQNYLKYCGILKTNNRKTKLQTVGTQFYRASQVRRYWAPVGGTVVDCVASGTQVKTGDRLYTLLSFNKTGDLPHTTEVQAIANGLVYQTLINASVHEGEFVLATV